MSLTQLALVEGVTMIVARRYVRFGSKGDIRSRSSHVRFTPESGQGR